MNFRIGVDVGGTHTDAALLGADLRCLATVKVSTTQDVIGGIGNAIATLLERAGVPCSQIGYAMLGTTHCTNALVERQQLQRVGLLRLAAPSSTTLPPLSGWPADLIAATPVLCEIVKGGFEYDGRVLSEIDPDEVCRVLSKWRGQVDAIAICGVFSPVNSSQELQVAELVKAEFGDQINISLSCEIGSLGLLERENATILNAALGQVARRAIGGFGEALKNAGLGHVRSFLGQNDGTLMTLKAAEQYPIFTLGCGPTNSLRGAAFLSGRTDALVIDVGGTTSDIGVLVDGFPRESASAVEIGGIRLNLRMPDILALGLGGGTIVRQSDTRLTLGPDSVGYRLNSEAQVFGGSTLTLTDVAVAVGIAPPVGPQPATASFALCSAAHALMVAQIEEGIDRMKVGSREVAVVLVGGGSILLPDRLEGAFEVVRPPHFGAANAVGVAIAEMGAEIDRILALTPATREDCLDRLRSEVLNMAIQAGANPAAVRIIGEDITPLAYLPGNACRVRIKAAGPLQIHFAS